MRRILVAIVLAVAWSGLLNTGASAAATPLTSPHFPPPPAALGCYSYINGGWRKAACDTQASIKKYVPQPELLSGLGARFKTSTSRFTLSVVSVKAINTQGGSETDSINGVLAPTACRTTSSSRAATATPMACNSPIRHNPAFAAFGFENNVCVWQVDVDHEELHVELLASLGGQCPSMLRARGRGPMVQLVY